MHARYQEQKNELKCIIIEEVFSSTTVSGKLSRWSIENIQNSKQLIFFVENQGRNQVDTLLIGICEPEQEASVATSPHVT